MRITVAQGPAMRVQLRASRADGHRSIHRTPSEEHPLAERNCFLAPAEQAYLFEKRNPADAVLGLASARVGALYEAGWLDSNSVVAASYLLDRLQGMQTACERIASSPLPIPYVLLVHSTAIAYVLLVPFAMAEKIGWWTPLFNALLAYTLFGLDELAR
ncbi:Bestrophin, RFP-TM, chloride channel-domain-containing protein [Baffinella frigidus]|nr:Bestrophin, RFP-TM, chloride channel-domain-containing protein [Cryptophyta sp. CCMP2293]